MTLNYAVNLCTDNAYRDSVDNHQLTFVANPIFWEIKGNINLSEDDKEALRESIESVHENVLNSNYVILWSYSGDHDIAPFENYYSEKYPFLNGSGDTDDWTEEVWKRFEEENAFSRAAQTRRDDLIYYEGIPNEQVITKRIDEGNFETINPGPDSLRRYWNEDIVNLDNVGTIDIFSHGGKGSPNMYHSNYFVVDWYSEVNVYLAAQYENYTQEELEQNPILRDAYNSFLNEKRETLERPSWTDDMDIGARLNFHGCGTVINPDNPSCSTVDPYASQKIANAMGVPLQGNEYSSSFSEDRLYRDFIEEYVPYDRNTPIYQNTYGGIIPGFNWPSILPVKVMTFYPEGE